MMAMTKFARYFSCAAEASSDFAIEVAADALGLAVFALVGAGLWGRVERAAEWAGRVEDRVCGKERWRR